MKKFLNIQIPRFLILFGWLIILVEYLLGIFMDTSLGQETLNLGLILFTLGATPVLYYTTKKMAEELLGEKN